MDEAYFKLAVWLNDKGLYLSFCSRLLHLWICLRFKGNTHNNRFFLCIQIEYTQMQKIIDYNRGTKIIWLERWHCFNLWTHFYRCSILPSICVIKRNWKNNSLVKNRKKNTFNLYFLHVKTGINKIAFFPYMCTISNRFVNISANYWKFAWVCVPLFYGTIEIGEIEFCYVGRIESYAGNKYVNYEQQRQ